MTAMSGRVVLTPQADPTMGQLLSQSPSPELPADLALVEGGEIVGISGSGTSHVRVSRLPQERMAAMTWEEIARTLRTAEDGEPQTVDVELRPGGELVMTGREQTPQPLSQLPKGRMAWLQPT
jgi:hypothetical protein